MKGKWACTKGKQEGLEKALTKVKLLAGEVANVNAQNSSCERGQSKSAIEVLN